MREVERLYLDMIAARAALHLHREPVLHLAAIAAALARAWPSPTGRRSCWCCGSSATAGSRSSRCTCCARGSCSELREADRHGRFHVYYPHVPGLAEGSCLDVHSKLMIVDDEWLRIGSSNLSQPLDGPRHRVRRRHRGARRADVAQAIRGFRDRLFAEHLGKPIEKVRATVDSNDSLHDAIRKLQSESRSLRVLEVASDPSDAMLDLAAVADPERPVSMDQLIEKFGTDTRAPGRGPAWIKLGLLVFVLAGLALAWRYTPLSELITTGRILATAEDARGRAWVPLVVIAAYSVAAFVLFPRPLITLFAVIAFGSVLGFVYGLIGIVGAALTTYYTGRALPRDTIRRLAGARLNNMSELVRKRGLLAVFAVRIVPVAPFAVVGFVAGAIRVRLRHYVAGTLLGMAPGTLATSIFGDQLTVALRDPSRINYWVIAGVALCFVVLIVLVRRWFARFK